MENFGIPPYPVQENGSKKATETRGSRSRNVGNPSNIDVAREAEAYICAYARV